VLDEADVDATWTAIFDPIARAGATRIAIATAASPLPI
jgi:hypothetical protein